jgi:hypothetical protein
MQQDIQLSQHLICHVLAGQIPAITLAVGNANAKLSLLLFACYGQLGDSAFNQFH